MLRIAKAFIAGLGLICAPAFASISFVTTPSGLGSNDSTNWSQEGPDQTELTSGFDATSSLGISLIGDFEGTAGDGLVAVVCPATPSCSWTTSGTGMNAGDSDIWAFDNTSGLGTGPLSLAFGTDLLGAGAWIEGDTNGQYTAEIQVYNGATLLFTSTAGEGTSDSSGDPVFLGVLDTTPEITSVVFSLTSCGGCSNLGDFAIDTLLMTDPASATPEPSSLLLLGSGLAGMAWTLRRKSWKKNRRP
jgi:hypothetical protein